MSNDEMLEAILDKVSVNVDTADAIYAELNTRGQPTIKGLLLEAERRGANIEAEKLPVILRQLLDIETAILASALMIAKPAEPEKTLESAYKSVNAFLDKKAKGL